MRRKSMKKLGLFLLLVLSFLLVACSNAVILGKNNGSVSIVIDEALASQIRSAAGTVSRNAADGTIYSVEASIVGDYSASQSVSTSNVAGTTFVFDSVPIGKNVLLNLSVKIASNYIWYGNSGYHEVKAGQNNLTIALGRVSGVLLWDSNKVTVSPYGNYDMGGGVTVLDAVNPPVYCFDNKGNLYTQVGTNGVVGRNIQKDGTYPNDSTDNLPCGQSLTHLSYDNVTSTLYGIGQDTKLYKLIEGSVSDVVIGESVASSPMGLAVHGNIAYVASSGKNEGDNGKIKISLKRYDLPQEASAQTTVEPKTNEIQLPDAFDPKPGDSFPNNVSDKLYGQMIYQEGALYMVLSCSFGTADLAYVNFSVSDCGVLVKINPSTLQLDTSFGSGGWLGLAPKRTVDYTTDDKEGTFTIYSAKNNEEPVFIRPHGFVAVMPKKLVIADSGCVIAGEVNDSNKVNAYGTSRIVTVDLENQNFSFTDIDLKYYFISPTLAIAGSLGSYVDTNGSN